VALSRRSSAAEGADNRLLNAGRTQEAAQVSDPERG
jgi:hypothetical protein